MWLQKFFLHTASTITLPFNVIGIHRVKWLFIRYQWRTNNPYSLQNSSKVFFGVHGILSMFRRLFWCVRDCSASVYEHVPEALMPASLDDGDGDEDGGGSGWSLIGFLFEIGLPPRKLWRLNKRSSKSLPRLNWEVRGHLISASKDIRGMRDSSAIGGVLWAEYSYSHNSGKMIIGWAAETLGGPYKRRGMRVVGNFTGYVLRRASHFPKHRILVVQKKGFFQKKPNIGSSVNLFYFNFCPYWKYEKWSNRPISFNIYKMDTIFALVFTGEILEVRAARLGQNSPFKII